MQGLAVHTPTPSPQKARINVIFGWKSHRHLAFHNGIHKSIMGQRCCKYVYAVREHTTYVGPDFQHFC